MCVYLKNAFVCALCECVCVPLESNVMHTVDTQTSRGRCGASLLPLSTIGHPRNHFCFPLRSLPPSLLGAARAFRFRGHVLCCKDDANHKTRERHTCHVRVMITAPRHACPQYSTRVNTVHACSSLASRLATWQRTRELLGAVHSFGVYQTVGFS